MPPPTAPGAHDAGIYYGEIATEADQETAAYHPASELHRRPVEFCSGVPYKGEPWLMSSPVPHWQRGVVAIGVRKSLAPDDNTLIGSGWIVDLDRAPTSLSIVSTHRLWTRRITALPLASASVRECVGFDAQSCCLLASRLSSPGIPTRSQRPGLLLPMTER